MSEDHDEKSIDATPHRRQLAREQGQVAHSQELSSALLLTAGVLVLMSLGGAVLHFCGDLLVHQLSGDAWLTIDRDALQARSSQLLGDLSAALLPALGLMLLVAVAANLLQTGFIYVPERIMPNLSRISPLDGMQRLFSMRNTMRVSMGLIKLALVGGVAVACLYSKRAEIAALTALEAGPIALYLWELAMGTALKIGGALLILAALDYLYQRWRHEQDLRMTPQEMREEIKALQGNPQVTARRRAVQRQSVHDRTDVVLVNVDVVVVDRQVALAIRYAPDRMDAPIVANKGTGEAALRIRRAALAQQIPIVEQPALAQVLYRRAVVNRPIPKDHYADVAQVLADVVQHTH